MYHWKPGRFPNLGRLVKWRLGDIVPSLAHSPETVNAIWKSTSFKRTWDRQCLRGFYTNLSEARGGMTFCLKEDSQFCLVASATLKWPIAGRSGAYDDRAVYSIVIIRAEVEF